MIGSPVGHDLNGAAVIVAGATGGLGSAVARVLRDRGAGLVLVARDEHRLAALDLPGPRVAGDIADSETGRRAVEAAFAAHGRLDGLINAAGEVAFGPLAEVDDVTLDRLVASNLLGPLRMMRAALPHLAGGFVVNLSAVVAEQPPAGMVTYAATKAGLTAADTALRREVRRQRIDVIDVRPPHTETGLADRPIAGSAPDLAPGLASDGVAEVIVAAIEDGARDVPASAFTVGADR